MRGEKKVVYKSEEIRVKNPKSLKVYGKCMELNKIIYQLVKQYPPEERYAMVSQTTRSCTSIGANLSEGNGQIFPLKEINFYNNSIGSANELIYWLDVSLQNGYISKQQYNQATELTQEIIKMLVGMMRKLKSNVEA